LLKGFSVNLLTRALLPFVLLSAFVTACADETGYTPRVNYGYDKSGSTGNGKGSGNGGSSNNDDNNGGGGGSATNNPTTNGDDDTNNQPAPPPPPSTTQADAGSKPDSSTTPTPTAPPGSCLNPDCTADGNGLCGCKAHDAQGNLVLMGCQDGACACFDLLGNDTNDFNATCDDLPSAQLAFQQCGCVN
jgi:hypothetical protein